MYIVSRMDPYRSLCSFVNQKSNLIHFYKEFKEEIHAAIFFALEKQFLKNKMIMSN